MYQQRHKIRVQEESIYALIPEVQQPRPKQAMYRSKYPAATPPTASTFGRSAATSVMVTNLGGDYQSRTRNHKWKEEGANFGRNSEHYSDPTSFLKKNTKESLPSATQFSYDNARRKPAVVKASEKPAVARRPSKNFIKENALNVIMAEPKRQAPGPDYLTKKDYGQVPKYLDQVKQDITAEKEYIQNCIDAERQMYSQQPPEMQLIPESERIELVKKLKAKWEIVNKNYQQCTHMVSLDTIGKVKRKEEFESQLKQLEKAIEKMSKDFIFVQADQQYDQFF